MEGYQTMHAVYGSAYTRKLPMRLMSLYWWWLFMVAMLHCAISRTPCSLFKPFVGWSPMWYNQSSPNLSIGLGKLNIGKTRSNSGPRLRPNCPICVPNRAKCANLFESRRKCCGKTGQNPKLANKSVTWLAHLRSYNCRPWKPVSSRTRM